MFSRNVEIVVRGARAVQPSNEVRKVDYRLQFYKRIVPDGKGGFREIESPISPAAFKGALRHVACIVAVNNPSLVDAYLSLFGPDPDERCPLGKKSDSEGKLMVELIEASVDGKPVKTGVTDRDLVEVRPRVKIDRVTGSVTHGELVFSEVISSRMRIVFRLHSREDLTEDERLLLDAALNSLKGWAIGGWASLGFGLVEEVSWS